MRTGASTPEELETLLEDACLLRDEAALAGLFEDGAVLAAGGDAPQARGGETIARLATALWDSERRYVASPQRVLQARTTALVVAERAINVLRRGDDGRWRYAISLLPSDQQIT
jgi:hypothetical protein